MLAINRWSRGQIEQGLLPFSLKESKAPLATITHRIVHSLIGAIGFSLSAPFAAFSTYWNHKSVKPYPWTNNVQLPENLGVATSEYQVSGRFNLPHSTWANWEKKIFRAEERSEFALHYLSDPQQIVEDLQKLGITEYRCSIDWSALFPGNNHKLDQYNLQKYERLFRALQAASINVMVTLHHFNEPQWFQDKGGFEKEENIEDFINFVRTVSTHFRGFVKEWVTFNEPGIYAMQAYERGDYPPGVKDTSRAANVLANMMKAHLGAYQMVKNITPDCKVGISHNILRFRPYYWWDPIGTLVCHYLTVKANDVVMKFFETGQFVYQVPFLANVTFKVRDIQSKLDFFGVQYYSDPLIKIPPPKGDESKASTCYPHEKMTNMPYRFYPEGLASALEEAKKIKKPIYITEIGIDALTDEDQIEFYSKVFEIIAQHKEVVKTYIWSIRDNFEWNMGWSKRFGLMDRSGWLKHAGGWLRDLLTQQHAKAV